MRRKDLRFGLKSPANLLEKMAHDWKRFDVYSKKGLKESVFAAADYFLDSWAMIDWVYVSTPTDSHMKFGDGNKTRVNNEEYINYITSKIKHINICKEIANEFKHFDARSKKLIESTSSSPVYDFMVNGDSGVTLLGRRVFLRARGNGSYYDINSILRENWLSWRSFLLREKINSDAVVKIHLHNIILP